MDDTKLETSALPLFLTPAVLSLLLVACGDSGTSTSSDGPTTTAAATAPPTPTVEVVAAGDDEAACPTEGEEWEVAKLYIEHNATDEDTGVHGLFGGEAWQELCITDPDGNQIFLVDPQAQLHDLAVSDFFFESREPEATEYAVDDLRSDFPEGAYTVTGTAYDGVARKGTARFTHAIPTEPEITNPALAEDDVHVPADVASLAVPSDFLLPDTIYELEVLTLEDSGNQTISVGFFRTAT